MKNVGTVLSCVLTLAACGGSNYQKRTIPHQKKTEPSSHKTKRAPLPESIVLPYIEPKEGDIECFVDAHNHMARHFNTCRCDREHVTDQELEDHETLEELFQSMGTSFEKMKQTRSPSYEDICFSPTTDPLDAISED